MKYNQNVYFNDITVVVKCDCKQITKIDFRNSYLINSSKQKRNLINRWKVNSISIAMDG